MDPEFLQEPVDQGEPVLKRPRKSESSSSSKSSNSSNSPRDKKNVAIQYPCDCVICGVKLVSNMDNINHQCRQNRKSIQSFSCQHCSKQFANRITFRAHVKTHKNLNARPFACPIPNCKARFKQKMHMLRHQRTHTGDRPFSCTLCGRWFGQKSSCIRHLRGVHDVHDALQLQVGVHEVCKNRGG
jgi:uncharacterized Zn-finger protein